MEMGTTKTYQMGLGIVLVVISTVQAQVLAFGAQLHNGRIVDAIFQVASNLVSTNLDLLTKRAGRDRIPLAAHDDALLDRGGMVSCGPGIRRVGLKPATLVNEVSKEIRSDEILVETPERYVLAVNQTTAKQIGLNIPRAMLERAERLIP